MTHLTRRLRSHGGGKAEHAGSVRRAPAHGCGTPIVGEDGAAVTARSRACSRCRRLENRSKSAGRICCGPAVRPSSPRSIYLSTFSTHVALGDAPESVAGVRSLGILHAPGYPTYVLFARAFGSVFAIGSWRRASMPSASSRAALSIGVITLIARASGASRLGAVVGALALGTTASFWLNAGFAKHYPLTMLLVATLILFVLVWQQRGGVGWLFAAGASLALATGSGWELAAITLVALAVLLRFTEQRPSGRELGMVAAVFVTVAVAIWVFVLVRAGQHPALNWGEASSPGNVAT